jgi:HSP20 family protein
VAGNCHFGSSSAREWPSIARAQVSIFQPPAPAACEWHGFCRFPQQNRINRVKGGLEMITRMLNDFAPLLRLQTDMNRMFEDFFQDMPTRRPYGQAYPHMNLWEDGDAAYIETDLPGLRLEDLDVSVRGNEVTIAGARNIADQKDAAWHRRERSHGEFTRTLQIPWTIDADKVQATLRDGVLTVRLPKSESAKPKKVKVLTA